MSSKNWNCSYIKASHLWSVDEDQSNAGNSSVRVHCINCPQVDTLPAPYARQYLLNSRLVAAEALNGGKTKRPMDDETLIEKLHAVKLGGLPNTKSFNEDNPTLGELLTDQEFGAILLLIKQDREAAYQRGYNTGWQKHKRINNRAESVASQLRTIADTLIMDAKLTNSALTVGCPCDTCSGHCGCGVPGHHESPTNSEADHE